ncbi:MAG: hypothetical protein JST30_07685 [Armatimonadetes bacterium]|nr:hypothetical protein [Armatimonadota bacterium]
MPINIPEGRRKFAWQLVEELQGIVVTEPEKQPKENRRKRGVATELPEVGPLRILNFGMYWEVQFWLCGVVSWGHERVHDKGNLVVTAAMLAKQNRDNGISTFIASLQKLAKERRAASRPMKVVFAADLPSLPNGLRALKLLGRSLKLGAPGEFSELETHLTQSQYWHSSADRSRVISDLSNYVPVKVKISSPSTDAAFEEAYDVFSLFRACLNLDCHLGVSQPLGHAGGPYATHPMPSFGYVVDGEEVKDYGRHPDRLPPRGNPKEREWIAAIGMLESFARTPSSSSPLVALHQAIDAFQEAIDQALPSTAMASLWRSLELVVGTHKTSEVVERCSAIFGNSNVVRARFEALATIRNTYVHEGQFGADLMPGMQFAIRLVCLCLTASHQRMRGVSTQAVWKEVVRLAVVSGKTRRVLKRALQRMDEFDAERKQD